MWEDDRDKLGRKILISLYEKGMIKTWYRDNPKGWTLISGIWSPFYIQLRPISSYPKLLSNIGYSMGHLIKEECSDLDRILGVAMAGIPIATAISLSIDIPSCFTRKLEGVRSESDFDRVIKNYGEHSLIEGELEDGDKIGIIDDLVTKFDSKLIAIRQLNQEIKIRKLKKVECSDVIVLLDREQGSNKSAKEHGIKLHSLIPFTTKGVNWLREVLSDREYEVITEYLADSDEYQKPVVQDKLYREATNSIKNVK
jgi:uridine monophosphate synthetase